MPNSKQHREKAERNHQFLTTVDGKYHDWSAVVAFYTAVHLVERLRTIMPNATDQHSTDHQSRLDFLHGRHAAIHHAFRELYNASLLARYETHNSFDKQFPAGTVQKILVNKNLVAISTYVADAFRPPS